MATISVVIPSFNQKEYLSDAIESAYNQTYPPHLSQHPHGAGVAELLDHPAGDQGTDRAGTGALPDHEHVHAADQQNFSRLFFGKQSLLYQ